MKDLKSIGRNQKSIKREIRRSGDPCCEIQFKKFNSGGFLKRLNNVASWEMTEMGGRLILENRK